jgi:hypothetical protein
MLDSLATTVANDNATLGNATSAWTIPYRQSKSSLPAAATPFNGIRWVTETFLVVPLICLGLIGNTIAFAALSSRGCRGRRHQWHTHRAISVLLQV